TDAGDLSWLATLGPSDDAPVGGGAGTGAGAVDGQTPRIVA
ncbi:histidine phosphatase, partial [Xanthomonas citri pv. citri]|nr:histidine phosphatase [Xanthomonas citri pv. citri]